MANRPNCSGQSTILEEADVLSFYSYSRFSESEAMHYFLFNICGEPQRPASITPSGLPFQAHNTFPPLTRHAKLHLASLPPHPTSCTIIYSSLFLEVELDLMGTAGEKGRLIRELTDSGLSFHAKGDGHLFSDESGPCPGIKDKL